MAINQVKSFLPESAQLDHDVALYMPLRWA